jgi:hypothetical protein
VQDFTEKWELRQKQSFIHFPKEERTQILGVILAQNEVRARAVVSLKKIQSNYIWA